MKLALGVWLFTAHSLEGGMHEAQVEVLRAELLAKAEREKEELRTESSSQAEQAQSTGATPSSIATRWRHTTIPPPVASHAPHT